MARGTLQRRPARPSRNACSKTGAIRRNAWKVEYEPGIDAFISEDAAYRFLADHVKAMPETLGDGLSFTSRARGVRQGTHVVEATTVCSSGKLKTTLYVARRGGALQ